MSRGVSPHERYERSATRRGLTLFQPIGGRQHLAGITCACKATAQTQLRGAMPPDLIATHFQEQGWHNRGKRWTCPSCQSPTTRRRIKAELAAARPEKPPAFITSLPIRAEAVETAHTEVEEVRKERLIEPAALTGRQIAKVTGYLNLYFCDGHYVSGYSDHRIAEELGLSTAQIERLREESPYHGKLRQHSNGAVEVGDVRDQLLALRDLVDEQIARLDGLADPCVNKSPEGNVSS